MSLSEIVRGEGRVFGLLGANAALDGVHLVSERIHAKLVAIMPLVSDILTFVQVAVGLATLVYMILKIRRVVIKKKG